uniref:Putative ovule protein n=1 Tax=Solanum chacoense TaxID=4108 RepID=A0A0V0GZ98_SOLCH
MIVSILKTYRQIYRLRTITYSSLETVRSIVTLTQAACLLGIHDILFKTIIEKLGRCFEQQIDLASKL